MSTLAGALDPIVIPTSGNTGHLPVDESSHEPEASHINQIQAVKDDEPQDEEMQDLFGEDQDVEFAKHDEYVPPPSQNIVQALLTLMQVQQLRHLLNMPNACPKMSDGTVKRWSTPSPKTLNRSWNTLLKPTPQYLIFQCRRVRMEM